MRIVSPPLSELGRLRTPLTEGESTVLQILDRELAPGWEIYIQPHLNGLRPDFVLLNPRAGIIVIEVKDWVMNTKSYRVHRTAQDVPVLEYLTDVGWRSKQAQNPVNQVALYRDETQQSYCPHMPGSAAPRLVSCGIIFTNTPGMVVREILDPCIRHFFQPDKYPVSCSVAGADDLASGELREFLPAGRRTIEPGMTEAIAADLRHWLNEPEYSAEQREPLPLSPLQRRFVLEDTESGYRRIMGPAGSGKSMVLAARAARLLAEGKDVLVVTFNLTLINYLQDLAVRWPLPSSLHVRRNIVWLNFHSWCRRLCISAGEYNAYRQLWRRHFETEAREYESAEGQSVPSAGLQTLLDHDLPSLLNRILNTHPEVGGSFDAILIDEGQDFRPEWIQVIRRCLRAQPDMMIVADKSQDIYGTARHLTEEAMNGCGFRGEWAQLKVAHRLPAQLIPLLRHFATKYLPADTRDVPPEPDPQSDFYPKLEPCFLRWIQTPSGGVVSAATAEVLRLAAAKDVESLPIPDITVLVTAKQDGGQIVNQLEAAGIRSIHTFDPDDRQSRRLKIAFYKGDARIKVTTIHSFKGLESRALVLCIDSPPNYAMTADRLALFYTGLTRLKHTHRGAYLSVVCGVTDLADYGRKWDPSGIPAADPRGSG